MKKILYNKQKGFGILAVILTMIVLIALISFLSLGNGNTSNILTNISINNNIVSQASLIRARVLACAIDYPTGNNGTAYRINYPAATTSTDIATLTCPGAGNANIWTLLDGLSMPTSINGFDSWKYVNDANSIRIILVANSNDRITALPTIANILGPQASITGAGNNTLTWVLVR